MAFSDFEGSACRSFNGRKAGVAARIVNWRCTHAACGGFGNPLVAPASSNARDGDA